MEVLSDEQRKKGVVNSDEYKRNVIKKSRVKGTEYTNYKGVVHAKSIGTACNCKLKCFKNISEEQQMEVFTKFYNLSTKDGNKRLLRLQQLLLSGTTPKDKKGKQVSANTISATEKTRIHEHIASCPVKLSHYSSRHHYLSSDLTVKIMYSMFLQNYPDTKTKYEYYNKVSREEFNLKFGRQQIDACCLCEILSLKMNSKDLKENARRVVAAEMIVHKRRAKKFYTAIQESTKIYSGRFDEIQQYFPIRGHSFLPCDRDFAHIKRKLKKVDRVYILHEYVQIIACASSKQKPKLYKKNAISVETSKRGVPRDQKISFNISTFHQFSYGTDEVKRVVVAKDFVNSFMTHTFRLGLSTNLKEPLERCYPSGKVPIKADKMEHIQKLAKHVDDSEDVTAFWQEIFEWSINLMTLTMACKVECSEVKEVLESRIKENIKTSSSIKALNTEAQFPLEHAPIADQIEDFWKFLWWQEKMHKSAVRIEEERNKYDNVVQQDAAVEITSELVAQKCQTVHIERDVFTHKEGVLIETVETIESLTHEKARKYLGIKQSNRLKDVNEQLRQDYSTPTFLLLKTDTELDALKIITKTLMKKYSKHHQKSAIERINIPRAHGGRGLIDIKEAYKKQTANLKAYFHSRTDHPLHIAINATEHFRQKREQWSSKKLLGRHPTMIQQQHVNTEKSYLWLLKGELYHKTEGFAIAIQDQLISRIRELYEIHFKRGFGV
ncbi:hypothetical protein ILUMI_09888 [Ignelater luminosus]|uniref:Uncharacterized protein n=1 Tax=Ignelater luminosus TaxID=2038154 RepID=A0A8K0D4Y6_IGNLU|nr:hypothetical protein ILUMI_09888 [Ignelater luminosus]